MSKILHVQDQLAADGTPASQGAAHSDVLVTASMIQNLLDAKGAPNAKSFAEQFILCLSPSSSSSGGKVNDITGGSESNPDGTPNITIDKGEVDYFGILNLLTDEYPILKKAAQQAYDSYVEIVVEGKNNSAVGGSMEQIQNQMTKQEIKSELLMAQNALAQKDLYEKNMELFCSCLIYLLPQMSSFAKLESAVEKVITLLTDTTGPFPHIRLRLIMVAYNQFPVHERTALMAKKMFFQVLEYASKMELFHQLLPYLDSFESWIDSWTRPEEDQLSYKKELFYTLAQELPKLQDGEQLRSCLEFGPAGLGFSKTGGNSGRESSGGATGGGGKRGQDAAASLDIMDVVIGGNLREELKAKSVYKSVYWLKKYLQICGQQQASGSSDPLSSPETVSAIKLFIKEIISDKDDLSHALLEASIAAGSSGSELGSSSSSSSIPLLRRARVEKKELTKLFELLDLLVGGNISDFENWLKKYPKALVEDLPEITEADLRKKVQLLTLCSICSNVVNNWSNENLSLTTLSMNNTNKMKILNKAKIPLATLQKELKLSSSSNHEIDDLIMLAIHQGALEGRIDAANGVLHVTSVLQRDFGMNEWKELSQKLGDWMEKIDQCSMILEGGNIDD